MSKKGIEVLTWDEARKDVQKVNPGLAEQIDLLNPGQEMKLFKVRYPFGSNILKLGILHLPNDKGEFVSIHDESINENVRKDLSYTPNMPIGVLLKNTVELFYLVKNIVIPWLFMKPGRIFSLWGLLQEYGTSAQNGTMWHLVAGCRSLIILPKISDALGFKRLKKEFNLTAPMPTGMLDQWETLKQLTESAEFDSPWEVELLFFTEDWYQKIKQGKWKNLEYFLLKSAWKDTAFLRDENVFNLVFSRALAEKNLKPNPFLYDTVKHIYTIARGGAPGFKIATEDNCAPIERLEQIFADIYQLKFAPTFVHPDYFDKTNALSPIYYSLEVPTLMDFSPKSRKAANKMNDIREIKHIQVVIEKFIQEDDMGLKNTPIYEVITKIKYEYFHSDHDILNELDNTNNLCLKDEGMQMNALKYKRPICTTSPFLRGCIRIGVFP